MIPEFAINLPTFFSGDVLFGRSLLVVVIAGIAARDNFLAVYLHILGRINTDTHLLALHTEHGNRDIVPYEHGFSALSSQY